MGNLYDTDIVAWSEQQAALLRSGRLSEIDVLNIAEEIEDVGKSEKQQLSNRLAVLAAHLLKWRVQADHRGASWRSTIRVQRRSIARLLRKVPSLKHSLEDTDFLEGAWDDALAIVNHDTGIHELPDLPIWTVTEILDPNFMPD
jgi:ribosomal protein L29